MKMFMKTLFTPGVAHWSYIFGHGGQALSKTANVGQDAGIVDASDKDAFIAAAKTRQWDREQTVRTLA